MKALALEICRANLSTLIKQALCHVFTLVTLPVMFVYSQEIFIKKDQDWCLDSQTIQVIYDHWLHVTYQEAIRCFWSILKRYLVRYPFIEVRDDCPE